MFISLFSHHICVFEGFPVGSDDKESACCVRNLGSIPGLGRSSGGGHGNPAPVFLPRESPWTNSLVGYRPWGQKESGVTKTIHIWWHRERRIHLLKKCRKPRFHPWIVKIPWRRKWLPTGELPGEFHGQRTLRDYSLWGRKEWDTTEQLSTAQHT